MYILFKNMASSQSVNALQKMFLVLGITFFTIVMYYSSVEKKNIKLIENKFKQRPNFVFFLTDDQDILLNGLEYMKNVKNILINDGLSFSNAYVASPLCCPSRSSLLTGQYVHNHGAINNSLSGNCSSVYWQRGPEKHTFPTYLHSNGYSTFYAGKYLNRYGEKSAEGTTHVPPGWDWWVGLKGNSRYYNYEISVNGTDVKHGNDTKKDYLTEVIHGYAIEYLNNRPKDKPFFLMLATPAAHAPFTPLPKYSKYFSNLTAPRTKNFNIKNSIDKHWLLRIGEQPLSENIIRKIDEVYRNRLRTLLTVDDVIENIVKYLEFNNLLENTYVIFSSDNGYHLGQFSLPIDKREPYEFDTKVPLIIKGPNVPRGQTSVLTTNIDIGPTILDLAGIQIPNFMDGVSLKSVLNENKTINLIDRINLSKRDIYQRDFILFEHSGEGGKVSAGCEQMGSNTSNCNPEFACKCSDSFNNTYNCIRQIDKSNNFVFCNWKDDEQFKEAYDLDMDPYQLYNSIPNISKTKLEFYDKKLNTLVDCIGSMCA